VLNALAVRRRLQATAVVAGFVAIVPLTTQTLSRSVVPDAADTAATASGSHAGTLLAPAASGATAAGGGESTGAADVRAFAGALPTAADVAAIERVADAKRAIVVARAAATARARAASAARASRAAQRRHLAAVRTAAHRQAVAQAKAKAKAKAAALALRTRGDVAVSWARRMIGRPYVWGASGPSAFDCSGLTAYVWAQAGVYLSHSTYAQWDEGRHVSRSQLMPGDLVFFGSDLHHMGLYIGDGLMIDAPHTGTTVQVQGIDRSDYAGAVRPW
jgi:cell wall-associated NlpC family hydrolase